MYQRSRWSLRRRSARRLQCLTWSGEEVRARASNAILHAAANDRVNVVASIIHRDDILRARPSLPTVIGFNHCVCADVGSAYAEVREEEIDYPVAVGTDCAELTAAVLGVGSCLSDLSGRPCIPTIAGDGNHHRAWAQRSLANGCGTPCRRCTHCQKTGSRQRCRPRSDSCQKRA